jgi:carbamoyl-phosphate synthase small subunit
MQHTSLLPAILILEDGTTLKGKAVGKIGTTTGEVCFNTGMTGYQEIYTDPSYSGQILLNTMTHIGNYGVIAQDEESEKPQIQGMICNEFSPIFSRNIAESSLQQYFEKHNIVGISDIDTRQLVRHIRNKGAMNAIISSEIFDIETLKNLLAKTPDMNGLELSSRVSTENSYTFGNPEAVLKVAALDLGIKRNILNCLADRNVFVKVFPAHTSFEEMQQFKPNGYFISNGPGDPAAMPYAVNTVSKILEANQSLFGICLGHQILALASGIGTHKMHNGHRGLNHPVKNVITGKSEITSQNHGFGVNKDDIEKMPNVEITHVNLNDQSIEGIRRTDKPAFSVQYHPESSPGPHDSRYLFDDFIKMMNSYK